MKGEIEFLPGGEGRTYRVGNVVLKHINNDTEEYTNWVADLFAGIKESGFRISKPVANTKGMWITENGWTAWTFLEGDHNFTGHITESIKAITAFHAKVKNVVKPDFLDKLDSPYARADAYAWGDKPERIHSELRAMVEGYYALREPVVGNKAQLIHADLNPGNILLSPNLPPAIIDIAPYWRPPEFALAVYAYWVGPWLDNPQVLDDFRHVKDFDQMLIRAAIRMLLIQSELGRVKDLEAHETAYKIILARIR